MSPSLPGKENGWLKLLVVLTPSGTSMLPMTNWFGLSDPGAVPTRLATCVAPVRLIGAPIEEVGQPIGRWKPLFLFLVVLAC